jgi:hypothetical protein
MSTPHYPVGSPVGGYFIETVSPIAGLCEARTAMANVNSLYRIKCKLSSEYQS